MACHTPICFCKDFHISDAPFGILWNFMVRMMDTVLCNILYIPSFPYYLHFLLLTISKSYCTFMIQRGKVSNQTEGHRFPERSGTWRQWIESESLSATSLEQISCRCWWRRTFMETPLLSQCICSAQTPSPTAIDARPSYDLLKMYCQ